MHAVADLILTCLELSSEVGRYPGPCDCSVGTSAATGRRAVSKPLRSPRMAAKARAMSTQPATMPANSNPRRAVVALGANLGDRRATLEQAVALIEAEIGPVAARSAWLETPAMIHPDDPGPVLSRVPQRCRTGADGPGRRRDPGGAAPDRGAARPRPQPRDRALAAAPDRSRPDRAGRPGRRRRLAAATASRDAQARFRAGAVLRGLARLASPGPRTAPPRELLAELRSGQR